MSKQQNHSQKEAAQKLALAGFVHLLARFAVEDYLAKTQHQKPQEIPQFALDMGECVCAASAHNVRNIPVRTKPN